MVKKLLEREIILDARVRALGVIALACFAFHMVRYAFALDQPYALMWMCHVSALTMGIALLASWASIIRLTAFWTLIGFPVWIIDVISAGTTRVSVLTHTVLPIIAVLALSQTRVRGRVVLHGMVFYVLVIVATRMFTPPEANINLAFRAYEFLGAALVENFVLYQTILFALQAALLVGLSRVFKRYFPADALFQELAPEPAPIQFEAPPPVVAVPQEPGFRMAPKVSREEFYSQRRPDTSSPNRPAPAAAKPSPPLPTKAAPPAPAPPAPGAPKRGGLQIQRAQKDAPPRGFSLLEMMTVVAILGIMATIALPDLTPAVQRAKLRSQLDEVTLFTERARREARASGRCVRVVKTGSSFLMQSLLDADCVTSSRVDVATGNWDTANPIMTLTPRPGFTVTLESIAASNTTSTGGTQIVFRPNGRLRGDGDIDVADDGARWVTQMTGLPNEHGMTNITPAGRICGIFQFGAVSPATLTAPVNCNLVAGIPPPSGGGGY